MGLPCNLCKFKTLLLLNEKRAKARSRKKWSSICYNKAQNQSQRVSMKSTRKKVCVCPLLNTKYKIIPANQIAQQTAYSSSKRKKAMLLPLQ